MALRSIREIGDPILSKISKPVKEITPRLSLLIEDMWETMEDANGVGLAAVQVGILKRLFIVQVDEENKYTFINPEILETSGEQTDYEGCLSVPGKTGEVTRPNYVKVKAYDVNMQEFILEGEGLLARAILHENDHLDGNLYVSKVNGELYEAGQEPDAQEEEDTEE